MRDEKGMDLERREGGEKVGGGEGGGEGGEAVNGIYYVRKESIFSDRKKKK